MSTVDDNDLAQVREVLCAREVPPGAKQRVLLAVESRRTGGGRQRRWAWSAAFGVLAIAGLAVGQAGGVEPLLQRTATLLGLGESAAPTPPPRSGAAPLRPVNPSPALKSDAANGEDEPRPPAPAEAVQRGDTDTAQRPDEAPPTPSEHDVPPVPRPRHHGPTPAGVDSSDETRAPSSDLTRQVQDYKRAMAHADPGRRLVALRAFKQRWPSSPLLHEVDVQILATTEQTNGQTAAAAKTFLRDHPESPRSKDVRQLVEEEE